MSQYKTALIVGGTSGIGHATARELARTHRVLVTGRKDPGEKALHFHKLSLDRLGDLEQQKILASFVTILPPIDVFVYSAGKLQEKRIRDMSNEEILETTCLHLAAPHILLSRILKQRGTLPCFIPITSTAAFQTSRFGALYGATKMGIESLVRSASIDGDIERTLVVAPASTDTPLFADSKLPRDYENFLRPEWVAEQVVSLYKTSNLPYLHATLLRKPPRVELQDFDGRIITNLPQEATQAA